MPKKRRTTVKKAARNSGRVVGSDRISLLPDHIISRILSFVPTIDAVRTSLLSKRWRPVWHLVPTLHFSDAGFCSRRKVFESMVDECLMQRERAMHYIADAVMTSFKLSFRFDTGFPAGLTKWLSSPKIQNCVEELDIYAQPSHFLRSLLKPRVLLSGRSLVDVKLEGVAWDESCSPSLPSLKSLCLTRVDISSDTLYNVVTSCPSIEMCLLKDISRHKHIRISSSSLEFFEIDTKFQSAEVNAVNVQSLAIGNFSLGVDFSSCRLVRDLTLSRLCDFGCGQKFYDQISRLDHLENLTLHDVDEHVKITSLTLKTLSLTKDYQRRVKVTTETPNLVSFRYEGSTEFSLLMERPNRQLNGLFSIWRWSGISCDTKWYRELNKFLSNVNCSWNSVCLHVRNDEDLIIPRRSRTRQSPPWLNLRHLKVVIHWKLTRESELTQSLQWISPSLETLSIEKGLNGGFRKWL